MTRSLFTQPGITLSTSPRRRLILALSSPVLLSEKEQEVHIASDQHHAANEGYRGSRLLRYSPLPPVIPQDTIFECIA